MGDLQEEVAEIILVMLEKIRIYSRVLLSPYILIHFFGCSPKCTFSVYDLQMRNKMIFKVVEGERESET